MVHLQPGYCHHVHTGSARGLSLSKHLRSNWGWWVRRVNRVKINLSSSLLSAFLPTLPFPFRPYVIAVFRAEHDLLSGACCVRVHHPNLPSWLELSSVFSSTLPSHATVRGSSFDDKITYTPPKNIGKTRGGRKIEGTIGNSCCTFLVSLSWFSRGLLALIR